MLSGAFCERSTGCVSRRRSPVAPERERRSDPARSTRFSVPTRSSPRSVCAPRRCSRKLRDGEFGRKLERASSYVDQHGPSDDGGSGVDGCLCRCGIDFRPADGSNASLHRQRVGNDGGATNAGQW